MIINFLERANDVVHVGFGAEEKVLLEPGALFITDGFAVGALDFGVVEFRGGLRQVWAKGFVEEKRLAIKWQGVTAANRNSLRLQGPKHCVARGAKRGGVNAEQKQMIAVPRAIGAAFLGMNTRDSAKPAARALVRRHHLRRARIQTHIGKN